jgi:hypothetical protein
VQKHPTPAHRLLISAVQQCFCFGTPEMRPRSFLMEAEGNADMDREAFGPRQQPYPAEKARGGEIVLTTPLQRWVFVAGLVGAVLLVLIQSLFR